MIVWVPFSVREGGRGSPLLMLALPDSPERLSAIEDQKLGIQTLPAVAYTYGPIKAIIMFDRTTKLPAAVRTRAWRPGHQLGQRR
jgi:hypothetical protein